MTIISVACVFWVAKGRYNPAFSIQRRAEYARPGAARARYAARGAQAQRAMHAQRAQRGVPPAYAGAPRWQPEQRASQLDDDGGLETVASGRSKKRRSLWSFGSRTGRARTKRSERGSKSRPERPGRLFEATAAPARAPRKMPKVSRRARDRRSQYDAYAERKRRREAAERARAHMQMNREEELRDYDAARMQGEDYLRAKQTRARDALTDVASRRDTKTRGRRR